MIVHISSHFHRKSWLRALATLFCIFVLVGGICAQQDTERLLAGTQWFRNILHSRGLEPLNGLDDLATDPEQKILIVLGETQDLDRVPDGLVSFVRSGGAVLVASDRTERSRLGDFRLTLEGAYVAIPVDSPFCYQQSSDCIFVRPTQGDGPLFQGLTRIATNRAGYIRLLRDRRLRPLAVFPEESQVRGRPIQSGSEAFAAGNQVGSGRILVLSDHSVFINGMLAQRDNDNSRFAENCADWLAEDGRRTKVLFIEEGDIQTKFDIPIKELPPPPLPPMEKLVEVVDHTLTRMEEENWFGRLTSQLQEGLFTHRTLAGLIVFASICMGFYGLARMTNSRYRTETGAASFASMVQQLVPRIPLYEERKRALMRAGNYAESARTVARQTLDGLPGYLAARQLGVKPALGVSAGYWQRRNLSKAVDHAVALVASKTLPTVSLKKLKKLQTEMSVLAQAIQDGIVRVEL